MAASAFEMMKASAQQAQPKKIQAIQAQAGPHLEGFHQKVLAQPAAVKLSPITRDFLKLLFSGAACENSLNQMSKEDITTLRLCLTAYPKDGVGPEETQLVRNTTELIEANYFCRFVEE